ncbi:MAG: AAA family ATPase [Bdellovibrionales bacterium]|nr:AAA family ATPase [Bdellovibrionales bacterium]
MTPQRISALSKANILDEESSLKNKCTRRRSAFQSPRYSYSNKKTIAISNNKGGVGKTSIATSMARRMVDLGFEVLVVDLDPQANSTMFFLNDESLQKKIRYVLHDVITGKCNIEDAVIDVDDGLKVLPSSLLNSTS